MSNQQNAKPAFVGAVALLVAGAGAGFFLMVGANEPAQAEYRPGASERGSVCYKQKEE